MGNANFFNQIAGRTTGTCLRPGAHTWKTTKAIELENAITYYGTVSKDGYSWPNQRIHITVNSLDTFWEQNLRDAFGENLDLTALLKDIASGKEFPCWVIENNGYLNVVFYYKEREDL